MDRLRVPLSFEQRQGVTVLVWARWAVLGWLAAILVFPLRPNYFMIFVVTASMASAAIMNAALHRRLARGDELTAAFPLLLGVLDAAAVTAVIAAIDGFDNSAYVLYFPALMSFSAIFPGRISLTYSAAIIATYTTLSITIYRRFDRTTPSDWHDLGLRVGAMALTVVLGYLLVRIERTRRQRAVAAEAERQQQLFALEERTMDLERTAHDERQRLTREIHDGVSQGLYMIALGLEDAAVQAGRSPAGSGTEVRLQALVRVAKQTLFDARGLLVELNDRAGGSRRADDLVMRQVEEFRAVTGIAATVSIEGVQRLLCESTVSSIYRVLQEALANVYRHAEAQNVHVTFKNSPQGATLVVVDDGKGFDARATQERGHGLRSMRERAVACGGSIELSPAPGGGSRLALYVPEVSE